ncbi:MAG: hypothetical protein WA728_02970 [Xanthobacteraceae bacterium]
MTFGRALDLRPKNFPLTILGVRVEIPVTISFEAQTVGGELAVRVRAQGNLKGIQDKALEIARSIPMPSDNCARTGVNPVVNSVDSASIAPAGSTAVIAIGGHVTGWTCVGPLKTVIGADSVTLSVPVQVNVVDQREVGLKLAGPVTVTTGHSLTEQVANLLAGDVSASITTQLASALDATQARATLPSLPGLDVIVQEAEFASNGNDLQVNASGMARMSSDAFNTLLQLLSR